MAKKFSGASPVKRRKYDEAFKAEALRLASENRSTQAYARQLGISPTLLYRWQQAQPVAEVGCEEVAGWRATCRKPLPLLLGTRTLVRRSGSARIPKTSRRWKRWFVYFSETSGGG